MYRIVKDDYCTIQDKHTDSTQQASILITDTVKSLKGLLTTSMKSTTEEFMDSIQADIHSNFRSFLLKISLVVKQTSPPLGQTIPIHRELHLSPIRNLPVYCGSTLLQTSQSTGRTTSLRQATRTPPWIQGNGLAALQNILSRCCGPHATSSASFNCWTS